MLSGETHRQKQAAEEYLFSSQYSMRTFPWVYVGDDDDNDDNSGHVKQHSYSVCVMRYTHCMKTFGWLVGWFVCSPAGRTFYTR